MSAILPRLYQQSLTAADQLGTIKSQIEAVTGFDIIAASTDRPEILEKTSTFMQQIEAFKRAMIALNKATLDLGKKPTDKKLQEAQETALEIARQERRKYWALHFRFGYLENTNNAAAATFVELLSPGEKRSLEDEGFASGQFARTVNQKRATLLGATINPQNDRTTGYQEPVLAAIPPLQKWLTNLLAIYQSPVGANIDGILNYNSMDRTQLAVLLAVKYPSIAVTDWPEITNLILAGRRVSPWGYTQAQVDKINEWLKGVNDGTKAVGEFPELNL